MTVRCASAGHSRFVVCGGCGDTGKLCGVSGCSSSSKITTPSWPSGNHGGVVPQVNGPWLVFESRQHSQLVPPSKATPFTNRPAKFVDNGSRLSAADHGTNRPWKVYRPADTVCGTDADRPHRA